MPFSTEEKMQLQAAHVYTEQMGRQDEKQKKRSANGATNLSGKG
jgi:hypothetical protein